jgi:hypothetical protein
MKVTRQGPLYLSDQVSGTIPPERRALLEGPARQLSTTHSNHCGTDTRPHTLSSALSLLRTPLTQPNSSVGQSYTRIAHLPTFRGLHYRPSPIFASHLSLTGRLVNLVFLYVYLAQLSLLVLHRHYLWTILAVHFRIVSFFPDYQL